MDQIDWCDDGVSSAGKHIDWLIIGNSVDPCRRLLRRVVAQLLTPRYEPRLHLEAAALSGSPTATELDGMTGQKHRANHKIGPNPQQHGEQDCLWQKNVLAVGRQFLIEALDIERAIVHASGQKG